MAQENDGKEWSPSGWTAVTYNYYLNVPDGMLSSGVGLDFCLFEYQINPHSNTIFSVGLLDFIFDWRFLKTDLQFADDGSVGPIQIKDANATLFDLGFSFPIGITQRLGRNISASLFAAPGIAWVNYRNTYSTDLVKHSDTFTARKGGTGFRLDDRRIYSFHQDKVCGKGIAARRRNSRCALIVNLGCIYYDSSAAYPHA